MKIVRKKKKIDITIIKNHDCGLKKGDKKNVISAVAARLVKTGYAEYNEQDAAEIEEGKALRVETLIGSIQEKQKGLDTDIETAEGLKKIAAEELKKDEKNKNLQANLTNATADVEKAKVKLKDSNEALATVKTENEKSSFWGGIAEKLNIA